MDKLQLKKPRISSGNKLGRGAVALVTAASLLLGGLFSSSAELTEGKPVHDISPAAVSMVVSDVPDDSGGDDGDGANAIQEDKKRGIKATLRQMILRLPFGVRAFLCVPLWAVGWILLTGLSLLWPAVLSPLAGTIFGWVCTTAVLLLVLLGSLKLAFPDLPVKKILNRNTILSAVLGVALIGLLDSVLPLVWPEYDTFRVALKLAGSTLILVLTALPVFRNHRKDAAQKRSVPISGSLKSTS